MRSNPQGKPKDAQNGAAAKAASVLPGLQANSGEPIDVKSEQLEVDDIAKTAQFRRDVIARQGDAVLQAPELDIAYEGRSAMSESAAQPREGGAQTKLKAIAARGGVVMTSKDDRAEASTLDYDAASERARLAGEVVLTSVNERRVTARAAELDQKADTALLTGDVVVTQGKNTMRGQRLFLDRKAQRTRLESPAEGGKGAGRIQTVFYQNAAQKPEGAKAGAKGSDPGNPLAISFKSDPNQPIDIAADTLDVADADKKAVYRGTVVAKQGEFQVETAEMTAFYSGQAGLGSAPKPAAAKAGTKGETGTAAQLTRVEARQRVKVTGKDGQRAEAENADFDVKQNKIVMWGGTVRVEQVSAANPSKPNVVTAPPGARLVIDMNSGESRFEQIDAKPAGPAVSAAGPATDAASAATAAAAKSGSEPQKPRMRAVIFPQQAKEAAAQKAGELGIEKPAGKAQGEKAGTSKAPTSAWEATTAGPKERRP
jgi:lipopolysaccharide transport protein LptA